MLAIVLWPMVLSFMLWGVLAWLFRDDWTSLLGHWLQAAQDFLSQHDCVWLASGMTVVLLGLLLALLHFVPVINLLSPIYTGLVRIHYGLGQLRRLRAWFNPIAL